MISLRRAHTPASLLALMVSVCALLLALPAAASAAPAEPEGEPPLPQLAFEPGSYDFGMQEVNRSNGQATLQLRNVGTVGAPVYSVKITGPGAGAFWFGNDECGGRFLNPGDTCSVQINFNPNDAGPFEAQLRASSEGETTFTADLSGEGGRARLGVTEEPTNFGSAVVGSAGVTKAIEVTNSGNVPGGTFIAVIAGGAIGSFHLLDENCTGVLLAPGASCTVLINFQPLSSGVKTARLGMFGDSDGGVQAILTGVGLDPEPTALPPSPAGGEAPMTQAHRSRRKPRHGRALHRRQRFALAARRALH